jgi:hypothetical protein
VVVVEGSTCTLGPPLQILYTYGITLPTRVVINSSLEVLSFLSLQHSVRTFQLIAQEIPLTVKKGINNKVTFLEKFGTGAPNTTGAYELDISLTNDYKKAWREMHVASDVFVSILIESSPVSYIIFLVCRQSYSARPKGPSSLRWRMVI